VVVVILAVLAAVIAPRFAGNSARQAEVEAREVQRLLGATAEKTMLVGGLGGVALDYDSSAARLSLLVRRPPQSKTSAGAQSRNQDPWMPDPLIQPVHLDALELRQATSDGQALDRGRWRIEAVHGEGRPEVALLLATKSGQERCWTVTLPREATSATLAASPSGSRTVVVMPSRSIDLDVDGKGEQPW